MPGIVNLSLDMFIIPISKNYFCNDYISVKKKMMIGIFKKNGKISQNKDVVNSEN